MKRETKKRGGWHSYQISPKRLGQRISDALNPDLARRWIRTLADMTPEEITELEAKYGCSVKRT